MPFPHLPSSLANALAARGYAEPTPVQAAVLDPAAAGRDLLVSAQTGSGKTVAFGLAFADTLLEGDVLPPAGPPLALIIAPTRELAMQVHGELSWLYAAAGARVASCVGGMDPRAERHALNAGCHIVVGTPGRLRDHLDRGQLDPSALRVVVLDEADEMLDMGFRDELTAILDATPATRRSFLFSATLAREIVALARTYQHDALRIDTVAHDRPHGDIEYRAIRAASHEVENAIVNLLRFHEARATLVFCATRDGVKHLNARLLERGFAAVALSGELSQTERTHALQSLRDGRARVCIATDVAARGLDLPDLDLVIHADLPTNREMLLHRSGRTGRAGRKGLCLLIVTNPRRRRAELLLQSANIRAIWEAPPTADAIRARDQARLLEDVLRADAPSEEEAEFATRLMAEHSPAEIAAALIRLHRARLPAPEDLAVEAEPPRRPPSETVWFRAAVGRRNNADPKWLLPLICRLGDITRKDVGTIKVDTHETRFEIAAAAAVHFAETLKTAGENEIRIEPAHPAPFKKKGRALPGPARGRAPGPRKR